MLGFVLGSGRSSRLNVELRERLGVAHGVGSGIFWLHEEYDMQHVHFFIGCA